jgi:hypothetical protein
MKLVIWYQSNNSKQAISFQKERAITGFLVLQNLRKNIRGGFL